MQKVKLIDSSQTITIYGNFSEEEQEVINKFSISQENTFEMIQQDNWINLQIIEKSRLSDQVSIKKILSIPARKVSLLVGEKYK